MVYTSHTFFLVTCTIRWVHWPKEYLEISQMFLELVSYHLHMMLEVEGIALSFWNKSLILKHGKHKGSKKHDLHMSYVSRWTPVSLAVHVNSSRIYPTPLDTYHQHHTKPCWQSEYTASCSLYYRKTLSIPEWCSLSGATRNLIKFATCSPYRLNKV